ncbi:hypothetical protein EIN_180940, partial [Entamoeba invadens IP1]|uniref:hypothetical protein n=1 Tax=Entamoeba invadens IP1 TaxID=370355 RepID=UPI0002C3ED77
CDTALDIKLPYTALHSFSNSVTRRVCSNNLNAANFYKFSLAYDVPVDISTCFAKTVIDTGVEVSTGCQGASGATCIGSNSEGKLCNHKAAQMSFDAMKGQSYIMTVFNEALAAVNVKQYRIVAFALEIPANSMCSAATVVPHKQFYKQYLVLNRLAFKTELTDIGTTRGLYYLLNTDKAMKVSVDTCSMSTTMDTFILRHSGCVVNTVGDAKISTPLDYIDVMSTVRYSCDVHGTKLNFETVPNKDYYIFVAPYNFDEEGFMEVQFFMDYVDSDQSSNNDNTSSEEDNNVPVGWIVFGVLFYIMCAVVIAVVVVLIILKRKSSANYSSFE